MSDENFQNRLNRIAARHDLTRSEMEANRVKTGPFGKGSRGRYVASLVGALVSGCLTVALVRYVRFHLTGDGTVTDAMGFLMDAGISIVACIAIKELFKLHEVEFKTAQGIGVVLMVMGMHNLVFWAPQQMETLFSSEWVQAQRQATTPNSLWLGVQYLELAPKAPAPEAPQLPAVVYRN